MKAIRLHEPTGIDGLVFEEVPDAQPMLGDVLVKVVACGITHNELDWPLWTCRTGHRRSRGALGLPGARRRDIRPGRGRKRRPRRPVKLAARSRRPARQPHQCR